MSTISFLQDVWRHSSRPNDFVFLSTKSKAGSWRDHPFKYNGQLKSQLEDWFERYPSSEFDIYFSPLPYATNRRRKEGVQRAKLLWSDIDRGDSKKLKPSILWESSPGRYQGLWILKDKLTAEKAVELNKALTTFIGADKAGYDLTQVLRPPGTQNHKYKEHPRVKMISDSGPEYLAADIRKLVSIQKSDKVQLGSQDAARILQRYGSKIPFSTKRLLAQKIAPVGKRSDIIWSLENKLHECGLTPNEIIAVVKASAWNKYRGRHDEDIRLRAELEKILSLDRAPDEAEEKASSSLEMTIESLSDVMGSNNAKPGWLVEGFWMRNSHGIVAGEPKSFKSTLALDLAVSVASGKPFLNQFKVVDPGPVVYIQNENARWIMQDRLGKITGHKKLHGKVYRSGRKQFKVNWPPSIPLYMVNQQGFSLTNAGHQKLLEKILEEYKPKLLILDPLYLLFDGDLSSSQDLNPMLTWLLDLRNKHNCSIAIVHHWNKGGQNPNPRGGQRMLGSTTLHGWVDSAWYIQVSTTKDDKDEDSEKEVNKEAASATVVLDREFRGAGLHHKVDVTVSMGKFGTADYDVKVVVHEDKRDKELTPKQIETEILNAMKLRKNGVHEKMLASHIGIGLDELVAAVDQLVKSGKLTRSGSIIRRKES